MQAKVGRCWRSYSIDSVLLPVSLIKDGSKTTSEYYGECDERKHFHDHSSNYQAAVTTCHGLDNEATARSESQLVLEERLYDLEEISDEANPRWLLVDRQPMGHDALSMSV